MNANTSSEALRLATRLGEITFRDMVSVAKAISPENAIPRKNKNILSLDVGVLTKKYGPVPRRDGGHLERKDVGPRVEEAVDDCDHEPKESGPEDQDRGGDVLALGHRDVPQSARDAGDDGQDNSYRELVISLQVLSGVEEKGRLDDQCDPREEENTRQDLH